MPGGAAVSETLMVSRFHDIEAQGEGRRAKGKNEYVQTMLS